MTPDLHVPYFIGIAGGSGSGKTTLVRHIQEVVNSQIISILPLDAYYRDFSNLTPAERAEINFDHPESFEFDLIVKHVARLKSGHNIRCPVYDFKTHTRSAETFLIVSHPIIIIEGILIFAEPRLRQLIDLKIYLDVPADVRILRRIHRDMAERGRTLESITHQYLATVRPMHQLHVEPVKEFADIIIPEGGENIAARDMICLKIQSVLTKWSAAVNTY